MTEEDDEPAILKRACPKCGAPIKLLRNKDRQLAADPVFHLFDSASENRVEIYKSGLDGFYAARGRTLCQIGKKVDPSISIVLPAFGGYLQHHCKR